MGIDLGVYLRATAVLDEQKAWRYKVIEFLEKQGIDMKVARKKAAERWLRAVLARSPSWPSQTVHRLGTSIKYRL